MFSNAIVICELDKDKHCMVGKGGRKILFILIDTLTFLNGFRMKIDNVQTLQGFYSTKGNVCLSSIEMTTFHIHNNFIKS